MGISEGQLNEMQRRVAKNRTRGIACSVAQPPETSSIPILLADLNRFVIVRFIYKGAPVGKPRMTRRDKWKKRPCVLRYREFADGIRAVAGDVPPSPDGIIVTAHCPMPESWSNRAKIALAGLPMRQRPDWDNIGKAVCDALFDEDCEIWLGVTLKYWCYSGLESLEVQLLYVKS